MNAVDRYEFLNAKLRARIGLMRSSTLIDDMLKAPTLVDAVGCLRESGFAPLAEIYDKTGDLQEMGVALVKGEIAAYQEVARLSDPKLASFILAQLGKDEEDNLKNTIRLWYSGVVRMHSIRYRSAYLYKDKIVQDINWTAMINATDWSGVVEAAKGTIYEPVLCSYTQEDLQQHGLFDLEIALDKAWYAEMMRSVSEENAEENRKVQIVRSAISTLSYSELEAITHIFEELDGTEGVLVASKIADRVGITRSVIVNALRKFESAGVIESRSSGMKGTYIKVLNDVVFDELKKVQ